MTYLVYFLLFPFFLMGESPSKFNPLDFLLAPKKMVVPAREEIITYYLLDPGQRQEDLQLLLPKVKFLANDIPEIQDINLENVVAAKLKEAFKYRKGRFIAEGRALSLNALNGLPGPFYFWFQRQMGNQGLVNIVRSLGDDRAEIISIVGYAKSPEEIQFFQGRLRGKIVSLRGPQRINWEPIFQPEGNSQTLAEMDQVTKNSIDPRRYALEKLRSYLLNHE